MTTKPFTGFDIETRPRLDKVALLAEPYPVFNPEAVKYGNTKDPVKRAALLEQRTQEHADAKLEHEERQRDRAGLDPFTAEVCVIGFVDSKGSRVTMDGAEKDMLTEFWCAVSAPGDAGNVWVYWSGCGDRSSCFDLDFLVTRSRILGVPLPPFVRAGPYYSSRFVCLAKELLLYQRERYLSLTRAAELFGLYEPNGRGCVVLERKKPDDLVTGKNFHQFYDGIACELPKKQQRKLALDYLRNDLAHLSELAHRIL